MTNRILPALLALYLGAAPALALTADDFPGEAAAIIDTDGDGIITATEYDTFALMILPAMDTNEDGTVTKDEALLALSADQFTTADTNGDGILTVDELTTVLRADFAAADTDGNGQLD